MEKWLRNAKQNNANIPAGLLSDFAIVRYTVGLYDRQSPHTFLSLFLLYEEHLMDIMFFRTAGGNTEVFYHPGITIHFLVKPLTLIISQFFYNMK